MPRKYFFTRQINVFIHVYRAIAAKEDLEGYKFLTEVHRFCYLIKIRLTSDCIWMLLLFCGDQRITAGETSRNHTGMRRIGSFNLTTETIRTSLPCWVCQTHRATRQCQSKIITVALRNKPTVKV